MLLVAVLIPGIGAVRNGSQSWIAFGPFSIQPAEFIKVALIGKLACSMDNTQWERCFPVQSFRINSLAGWSYHVATRSWFCSHYDCLSFCHFVCCRLSIRFFTFLGAGGVGAFIALIAAAPYRLDRIKSYIDPWNDPLGTGFQGIQSLFAIAPGGLVGHGYGNSRQKYFICLNLKMTSSFQLLRKNRDSLGQLWYCYCLLYYWCQLLVLQFRTKGRYAFLMVAGMGSMIIFQTFLNVGVVSGLLPVTGVTLPFISYGGSSLMTTWIAAGTIMHFTVGKKSG